jgi:aspartate/methionine/tyrosine aminotransferase
MRRPPLSRRTAWDLTPSPLAQAAAARRARGLPVLDLSDTNVAHAGLRAPAAALTEALHALARDPAAARYEPDPRGAPAARAAIAAHHARAGAPLDPEQLILTAGTSEAYAHLFRLLGDPGDRVHLPEPGYPLFDHLAALEGLEVARYPLSPPRSGARWRIDFAALGRSLTSRSRAVLLIHPHNPTGSWVDPADLAALRALGREQGLALISDEVFAGSALQGPEQPSVLAGAESGPLQLILSGASKLLALPQLKLAWIAVAGPADQREAALSRLEFTADAYLSVSPLLAGALPALLAHGEVIRAELRARVSANRTRLMAALDGAACVLPAEAGWIALVRLSRDRDEEALALELLEHSGVLITPGFVFDLQPSDAQGAPAAHLVVSLLAPPERFERAALALARGLA